MLRRVGAGGVEDGRVAGRESGADTHPRGLLILRLVVNVELRLHLHLLDLPRLPGLG